MQKFMVLIRIIVLESLVLNTRVFARYVKLKENEKADALSRLQSKRFWTVAQNMNTLPSTNPSGYLAYGKIWLN